MAKAKILDKTDMLEQKANILFDRIKRIQNDLGTTLQNVRRMEKLLMEKEKAEENERLEREKQARLLELLSSDNNQSFHMADDDEIIYDEPADSPATDASFASKAAADASALDKPVEQAENTEAAAKQETKLAEETTPKVSKTGQTPALADETTPDAQAQKTTAKKPAEKPKAAESAKYASEAKPQQQTAAVQTKEPRQQRGGAQPTLQASSAANQPRAQQAAGQQRTQAQSDFRDRQQGGYAQRSDAGYQPRGQQQADGKGRQQGVSQFRPPLKDKDDNVAQRQQGAKPRQGGFKQQAAKAPVLTPSVSKERVSNYDPNKNNYTRSYDSEKKAKSKKAILKESAPVANMLWDEDVKFGSRRVKPKKQQVQHKPEPVVIEKAVITSQTITVKELSEKIGKPASEIIKKLFIMGTMATINQEIDFDTCALIAADYNIELELQLTKTYEDVLQESQEETAEDEANLVERPPVVTIMGHVDHGKTSLLDAIRHSSVTEAEAGGITQHIGAYTVMCNGKSITFIDTPGHEAFTSMRARGAQVTDIVVLVVAADDGIMPQTIEAINHAKAAEVPIIVAINKMDKPEANPDRVKQQLMEHGLVSEEWGGDTICVPVSAKKKTGIDSLLEMILLQAEVLELKANPNRLAKGTIIEAELHKGRGPIATVLVQNGTLKVGDTIVAGTAYGRVRAMMDDKGKRVESAGPSQPVEVLGFSEVPSAGDTLIVAEIDKLSRQVAEERREKQKVEQLKQLSKVSLDDLFNQIAEGQVKDLNIIVKADVQGSVEAVKQALEKLSNDEVRVRCIHGGVGAITASDIMFASASNAIVIGFNVRPDATAKTAAEREKVDVRLYRIIYNAIEDVQQAMRGMFAPVYNEVELGHASVREVFKITGAGIVAGCYVQDGKIARSAKVRVVRDGIVIHEGKISSLRRFKDDVREVAAGYECGISIENFNDIREGDVIEAFIVEEVKK